LPDHLAKPLPEQTTGVKKTVNTYNKDLKKQVNRGSHVGGLHRRHSVCKANLKVLENKNVMTVLARNSQPLKSAKATALDKVFDTGLRQCWCRPVRSKPSSGWLVRQRTKPVMNVDRNGQGAVAGKRFAGVPQAGGAGLLLVLACSAKASMRLINF
jgi:hypothetical protein